MKIGYDAEHTLGKIVFKNNWKQRSFMSKMMVLLFCFAFLFIIESCQKEVSFEKDENAVSTSLYSASFVSNGRPYDLKLFDSSGVAIYHNDDAVTNCYVMDSDNDNFNLAFPGNTTQNDLTEMDNVTMDINYTDKLTEQSISLTAKTISVSIDAYGPVGGVVSGTFSGKFYMYTLDAGNNMTIDSTKTVDITDGKFELLRLKDQ